MKTPDDKNLRESSWRRPLTPAQEAELEKYLAENPHARADWECEMRLSRALEKLPEAPPVSSNFTARVLETLRLEETAAGHERSRGWFAWRTFGRWVPRLAAVGLAMFLGFLVWHQHELNAAAERARNIAGLASVFTANQDVMADYKPISRLGASRVTPDNELIVLLK